MISSQALKALEKLIKSVRQICTLGHFMVFLATCSFVSCASNYLLRGQDMPFLRPFYAVSDSFICFLSPS
jgi:hypothetical protein